jgi:hypothetical protein
MKRFFCKQVLVISLLSIVTGCAPVYRTFYEYKPIASGTGKKCANECIYIKQQCESNAIQSFNACQARVELAYQGCMSRQVFGYDNEGVWGCQQNCFCFRDSCTDTTPSCEEPYKDCYVNCGGTVVATTQCVSNCEKALATSTVVYGEQPKQVNAIKTKASDKKQSSGSKKPQSADEKLQNMLDQMSR